MQLFEPQAYMDSGPTSQTSDPTWWEWKKEQLDFQFAQNFLIDVEVDDGVKYIATEVS